MINGSASVTASLTGSWFLEGDLYVSAIGASGALQLSNCKHGIRTAFLMPVPWEFAVDATAAITITCAATWNVAHAGNTSRLWRLVLERLA